MRKLSKDEIKEIKNIDGINNRKNFIQDIIIKEWSKTGKGLIQSYTGSGKSVLITKIILALHNKPDFDFIIVVPTTKLKEDFESIVLKYQLKNVFVTTIQSLSKRVKNGESISTKLFIIDEAHWCANSNSEFFSEILPSVNYKYVICTSATYEKNHLEYFKNLGLEIVFDLPHETGYSLQLLPDYITYCLGVNLTNSEKIEYIKLQKEYDNLLNFFARYDVNSPIGCISAVAKGKELVKYGGEYITGVDHAKRVGEALEVKPGVVIGLAMKWFGITSKRASLLNSCEELVNTSIDILKGVDEKIIVFAAGKESANYVAEKIGGLPYHSGLTNTKNKKNLISFESGENNYLITAKKLDQGYDLRELRLGLQFAYTSKKLQFKQRKGRVSRFDPNNPEKISVFICLYVKDFTDFNGNTVYSQQLKWLKSALYGQQFVEWIKDKSEIII